MPGTVLDPEDTDKICYLYAQRTHFVVKTDWKWSMVTHAYRSSDKGKVIDHKVAGRKRCGSATES